MLNKFIHILLLTEEGIHNYSKSFTNHSVRKTVVMKLKRAGDASWDITAIIEHKNGKSLKSYDENDQADHKKLRNIIVGQEIKSQFRMTFSSQQTMQRTRQL